MLQLFLSKLKQITDGTYYFHVAIRMFLASPIQVASIVTLIMLVLDKLIEGKTLFLLVVLITLHGVRNTCSPQKNLIHLMWTMAKIVYNASTMLCKKQLTPPTTAGPVARQKAKKARKWLANIKSHSPWQSRHGLSHALTMADKGNSMKLKEVVNTMKKMVR